MEQFGSPNRVYRQTEITFASTQTANRLYIQPQPELANARFADSSRIRRRTGGNTRNATSPTQAQGSLKRPLPPILLPLANPAAPADSPVLRSPLPNNLPDTSTCSAAHAAEAAGAAGGAVSACFGSADGLTAGDWGDRQKRRRLFSPLVGESAAASVVESAAASVVEGALEAARARAPACAETLAEERATVGASSAEHATVGAGFAGILRSELRVAADGGRRWRKRRLGEGGAGVGGAEVSAGEGRPGEAGEAEAKRRRQGGMEGQWRAGRRGRQGEGEEDEEGGEEEEDDEENSEEDEEGGEEEEEEEGGVDDESDEVARGQGDGDEGKNDQLGNRVEREGCASMWIRRGSQLDRSIQPDEYGEVEEEDEGEEDEEEEEENDEDEDDYDEDEDGDENDGDCSSDYDESWWEECESDVEGGEEANSRLGEERLVDGLRESFQKLETECRLARKNYDELRSACKQLQEQNSFFRSKIETLQVLRGGFQIKQGL
ncbi:unnamed protein product [Closterium sp. NIES-54]